MFGFSTAVFSLSAILFLFSTLHSGLKSLIDTPGPLWVVHSIFRSFRCFVVHRQAQKTHDFCWLYINWGCIQEQKHHSHGITNWSGGNSCLIFSHLHDPWFVGYFAVCGWVFKKKTYRKSWIVNEISLVCINIVFLVSPIFQFPGWHRLMPSLLAAQILKNNLTCPTNPLLIILISPVSNNSQP